MSEMISEEHEDVLFDAISAGAFTVADIPEENQEETHHRVSYEERIRSLSTFSLRETAVSTGYGHNFVVSVLRLPEGEEKLCQLLISDYRCGVRAADNFQVIVGFKNDEGTPVIQSTAKKGAKGETMSVNSDNLDWDDIDGAGEAELPPPQEQPVTSPPEVQAAPKPRSRAPKTATKQQEPPKAQEVVRTAVDNSVAPVESELTDLLMSLTEEMQEQRKLIQDQAVMLEQMHKATIKELLAIVNGVSSVSTEVINLREVVTNSMTAVFRGVSRAYASTRALTIVSLGERSKQADEMLTKIADALNQRLTAIAFPTATDAPAPKAEKTPRAK